jgi:protein-disulfide isomerase
MLKVPPGPEDHALGPDDAAVTLVEYGDYQCPYCRAAQAQVKATLAQHPNTRLIFRQFPLTEMHPMAGPAAAAAEFAGTQGRFWEMHDALYARQDELGPGLLLELLRDLGLSPDDFREAIAGGALTRKVEDDFMGGVRSGVNGTPTFFINGVRHEGDYSSASLSRGIEQAGIEQA